MEPAPAAEKKSVYIKPATDGEALDDLYCLHRVHRENCQMAGCEHCRRMDRVRDILMALFREEKYYSVQIAKRKAKGAGK